MAVRWIVVVVSCPFPTTREFPTPVDGQDDDVAILFVLFDLFFQLSYCFTGLIELKDANSSSVWLCLPRIWNTTRIVPSGKHQHPGIIFKLKNSWRCCLRRIAPCSCKLYPSIVKGVQSLWDQESPSQQHDCLPGCNSQYQLPWRVTCRIWRF